MKRPAKVTVLISIHNGAETLDRCFRSLADQTMQDFEIVCVDDVSTDQTPDKLRVWQKTFGGRLRVIRNEDNLGLTKSLNKGLALIQTPYTARIDADDWWKKDKLAKQIAFMDQHHEYGVVGTNYVNVSPQGEKPIYLPENDREIRQNAVRRNPFAHGCVVFRTDLVKGLGGYDENVRYGQDYELWLRALPKTKFCNLPELLCYRTTGSGISVEKQKEQMWQSIRTQSRYIRKYRYPITNYLSLAEPLMLVLTPDWIKTIKRKLFG